MRILAIFTMAFFLCVGILAGSGGGALAAEKNLTPLGEGIPMIEGIKMLEVGATAPDFTVKDSSGVPYHYGEEKGKSPSLFVFWSIFCEPCRIEMPVVQKLFDKYRERGLDVLAVALDGEPLKSSIVGFVKQEGFTFRVLIDELDEKEMFKVADPYGVAGTPTIYIMDRAGKVVFARAGRVKEEDLDKALQSVLTK